jgi:hypothetical protein
VPQLVRACCCSSLLSPYPPCTTHVSTCKPAEAITIAPDIAGEDGRKGAAVGGIAQAGCCAQVCSPLCIAALYVNRALCSRRRGNAQQTLEDAEHALELDSSYMKVRVLLCRYTGI